MEKANPKGLEKTAKQCKTAEEFEKNG